MIDHVAAVVLVMLVRLHVAVRIFGTGQQSVLSRLLRCKPIQFPTSPRMPLSRVQKFCLCPGLAAVSAHRDLSYLGLARPCSAGNCIYLVRCERFVNTWPGDFGLQLHFCQRATHGLSIQIIPVAVVRCLPVTSKRLSYSVDTRQPLDGSHSIMTGDNYAHRISMILRKITAIHLVSDQYFLLNCFVSRQTTGI